jgi:hypothetical protein
LPQWARMAASSVGTFTSPRPGASASTSAEPHQAPRRNPPAVARAPDCTEHIGRGILEPLHGGRPTDHGAERRDRLGPRAELERAAKTPWKGRSRRPSASLPSPVSSASSSRSVSARSLPVSASSRSIPCVSVLRA